jgi:hypothetical protein
MKQSPAVITNAPKRARFTSARTAAWKMGVNVWSSMACSLVEVLPNML